MRSNVHVWCKLSSIYCHFIIWKRENGKDVLYTSVYMSLYTSIDTQQFNKVKQLKVYFSLQNSEVSTKILFLQNIRTTVESGKPIASSYDGGDILLSTWLLVAALTAPLCAVVFVSGWCCPVPVAPVCFDSASSCGAEGCNGVGVEESGPRTLVFVADTVWAAVGDGVEVLVACVVWVGLVDERVPEATLDVVFVAALDFADAVTFCFGFGAVATVLYL